ncbi:MAG: FAD-binding oxidoreductase [Nitrincola sp.]|nr:FAD-binding oxidoreductase [Nitrincola sp.]
MNSPTEHTSSWYAATRNIQRTWPELQEQLDVDICIVGAGFTGVNSAIELAQRGFSVALLEARRVGWGASGRNGGELIRGIGHDLDQFRNTLGDTGVLALKKMGTEALEIVKQRIQEHQIDCDLVLGYADLGTNAKHRKELDDELASLQAIDYPHRLTILEPAELKQQVVNSDFYTGALVDEGSGHLHPLNLLLGEAQVAEHLGVKIFEHSAVVELIKGDRPKVKTAKGLISCSKVILGCNGYLNPDLEPWLGGKVLPAGSYVIATEPLPHALCETLMPGRKAVADMRTALDYYRISRDNRLIFGGLCTYTGKDPKNIAAALAPNIAKVFPQLGKVKIDYQWGGMLGIGANRLPR